MRKGQNPAKSEKTVAKPEWITVALLNYIPFLSGFYAEGLDVLKVSLESMRNDAGLPFDLMVESDVTATLWWFQVERLIGRLDERLTELVVTAVRTGAAVLPRRVRGVPVVDADDPRRALRSAESQRMGCLGADCESAGVTGGATIPLVVDPALVAVREADDAAGYSARLTAGAAALATSASSIIPSRAAAVILEAGDRGLRLPCDVWRGLQPCLERALSDADEESAGEIVFEPGRTSRDRWADRALAEACAGQLAAGARAVRLLTTSGTWSGSRQQSRRTATAGLGGDRRLRLIHHHLEVHP
jgi:hypothetical protein